MIFFISVNSIHRLSAFTTDASGQLNVLWHDGHTFSMNGAQVGVFEQTDQIGLERERENGHGSLAEDEV